MDGHDLDAWFERVSYKGSRAPTLAVLNALILAHTTAVPFENVDVLLGVPISLDEAAVFAKLVVARRGGYCFEQNGLFLRVLRALDFDVTPLSARVRVQRSRDVMPPRTHMFLRVVLDGQVFLVDVGVGGLTPTCALPAPDPASEGASATHETPHEPRRFVVENTPGGGPRRFFHQALRVNWQDVCEFTFEEMFPIDQELANWFTSAHPQSHFKNRLVVARVGGPGVRHTLLNRDLTVRREDGSIESRRLRSREELGDVLADVFGIAVAADADLACEGLTWESAD